MASPTSLHDLLGLLVQAHPWHGVEPRPPAPGLATAFIEIVPTDAVKYELDKTSGHLRIDRPQRYSNLCPTMYGFIPRTYCGDSVGERAQTRTGLSVVRGDGDPLDICVLSEKPFAHGNFLCTVRPIGGLRMIDNDEADDKIVAVLDADATYGAFRDLKDCPKPILDRLQHYFLTYKLTPDAKAGPVQIAEVYDAREADEVIARSIADYRAMFGEPEARLAQLTALLRGP